MKRHLLILACAVPWVAYGAYAADTPDASFYKHAAEAGLAEVSDATLAQQTATDPKLKDFAAMMIKDHSAANDKLSALAGTKNITLPTSASVGEMATHEKLKLESGTTFDNAYTARRSPAARIRMPRILRSPCCPPSKDTSRRSIPSRPPTAFPRNKRNPWRS
jgi:predicted outer membrane protein